jgi:hypothetical protein
LVITTVAERGRLPGAAAAWLAGQLLVGRAAVPSSPGCWTLMKMVRPSGVESMPVISHSFGPVRKRRTVAGRRLAPDQGLLRAGARAVIVGDGSRAAVAGDPRHRRQQLIVGLIGEGAVVRFDPQHRPDLAGGVGRPREPEAVGAREVVLGGQVRQVDVLPVEVRARSEQVDVPAEGGRLGIVARLAQPQDVAVGVADGALRRADRVRGGVAGRRLGIDIGARIGRIGVGRGARRIVGERDVHLTGGRIDGGPFRPIHAGRADRVGGEPGVDQHVGLILEGESAVARRQAVLAEHERNPNARSVGVKRAA